MYYFSFAAIGWRLEGQSEVEGRGNACPTTHQQRGAHVSCAWSENWRSSVSCEQQYG